QAHNGIHDRGPRRPDHRADTDHGRRARPIPRRPTGDAPARHDSADHAGSVHHCGRIRGALSRRLAVTGTPGDLRLARRHPVPTTFAAGVNLTRQIAPTEGNVASMEISDHAEILLNSVRSGSSTKTIPSTGTWPPP